MNHSKKSMKRTLLCTNLLLASFVCTINSFAGVAGRGVDPSVLEANAIGPGAHTDGVSISSTTENRTPSAAQAMTQDANTGVPASASAQTMTQGVQTSAAVQATPADSSSNASAVSGIQTAAPTGVPETQPVQELLPPTEDEIANYFQGAYVTGDSVAYGFQLYANRQKANSAILQNLGFLTRGSFSAHNAFMAISKKSVHPTYQGAQHHIWDSLQLVGAKHVFMFFGLNDLNIGGVDSTVDYYVRLINQIRAVNPDIAFTIISTTPMYQGSEKGKLTNANIDALNARMQALCTENGWGYLDIASHLKAANGTLAAQYCSDHYVHETNAAYAIWLQCFHDYAQEKLIAEKLAAQTKA